MRSGQSPIAGPHPHLLSAPAFDPGAERDIDIPIEIEKQLRLSKRDYTIDCGSITGQMSQMINRRQIRAARALLGWSAKELADKSRLGVATIVRAETGRSPAVTDGNLYVIQHTLEEAGIIFLDKDQAMGGGSGVRWAREREPE
jgi:Helix-turn-helix